MPCESVGGPSSLVALSPQQLPCLLGRLAVADLAVAVALVCLQQALRPALAPAVPKPGALRGPP